MNGYGNSVFLRTAFEVSSGGTPPANTVAPVISGTQVVGSTLTSTTGTWTGTPVPTFTYQWFRGATLIGGATSSTYVLVQADAGNTSNITCQVTGTNAFGNATATSNILAQIFDFDANAFITSATITNTTQKAATNSLTIDLKGYSIWTKIKTLYPLVGGTATSHSYNLKNTAQFQITWVGGVTHSSNGVQYNGTNSYGNTNFNCNTNTTILNNCVGAYSRTNGLGGAAYGAATNVVYNGLQLYIKFSDNNTYYAANDNIITGSGNFVSDTRGFFIVNRESSTVKRLYKNSTSIASSNPAGNDGVLNGNLFLGARNNEVAPTDGYDNKQYALNFVSSTLTGTEITNLTTAVQAFQTTLGRQV